MASTENKKKYKEGGGELPSITHPRAKEMGREEGEPRSYGVTIQVETLLLSQCVCLKIWGETENTMEESNLPSGDTLNQPLYFHSKTMGRCEPSCLLGISNQLTN